MSAPEYVALFDDLLVEVTWKDIESGVRGTCDRCPVALAVARTLAEFAPRPHVSVEGWYIHAAFPGTPTSVPWTLCWRTPPEVSTFIRMFDRGARVIPFSFEQKEGV